MRRDRAAGAALLIAALIGALLVGGLSVGASALAYLGHCDENVRPELEGTCDFLDEGGGLLIPAVAAGIAAGGVVLADRAQSVLVAVAMILVALVVGVLGPFVIVS